MVFGLLFRSNHAIVFTRCGRFRECDACFSCFSRAIAVFCASDNGKIEALVENCRGGFVDDDLVLITPN